MPGIAATALLRRNGKRFHEACCCQVPFVSWAFCRSSRCSRHTSTERPESSRLRRQRGRGTGGLPRSRGHDTSFVNGTHPRFDDDGPTLAASRSSEHFGSAGPSIRVGDCCTEHPRLCVKPGSGSPFSSSVPLGTRVFNGDPHQLVVRTSRAPDKPCHMLRPPGPSPSLRRGIPRVPHSARAQ
jgi:hypothetical protein